MIKFTKSIKKGFPEVLSKQAPVTVDPHLDYTLELLASEHSKYKLASPFLVGRGIITRNQDPETIPYKVNRKSLKLKTYPNKIFESQEYFLIRNVAGYNFKFNITQFKMKRKLVKVFTHLQFKLPPNDAGTVEKTDR